MNLDAALLRSFSEQSGPGTAADEETTPAIQLPDPAGTLIRGTLAETRSEGVIASLPPTARQVSRSEVADLNLLEGLVTAKLVRAQVEAYADGYLTRWSTNGSLFVDLKVNGMAISNVVPNMTIDLPAALFGAGSYVRLFEVAQTEQAPPGLQGGSYVSDLSVVMIRVHITDGNPLLPGEQVMDLAVAQAEAHAMHPQAPPVRIRIASVSVLEPDTGITEALFSVSLSRTNPAPVQVRFSTLPGTALSDQDFTPVSGELTFPPGETNRLVAVPVLGDQLHEEDEQFTVELSDPVQALIEIGSGTGTIRDNDPAPLLLAEDISVMEGDSGTVQAFFPVRLSAPSAVEARVQYRFANQTAQEGSDYTAGTGTLVFPPGSTLQQVEVGILSDLLDEPDETFLLMLEHPVRAGFGRAEAVGTILDNDPLPQLSIQSATIREADTNAQTLHFVVTLSAPSARMVQVAYQSADGTAEAGSDYTATAGVLTFPPGETARSIPVEILSDLFNEPTEEFFVHLSAPVHAVIASGTGVGTILDNDPTPSLSVDDLSVAEGHAGTTVAEFSVRLSTPFNKTVRVNYLTVDGTARVNEDYLKRSGTLQFSPGQTLLRVQVPVIGDELFEPDETFLLNLSTPVNATIADPQGVATILNDDAPPVDLELSVTDFPDPVRVTCELTYFISVTNRNPYPATGVLLQSLLPQMVDFVSAEPTQGSYERENQTLRFQLGRIEAFGSARVVVKVIPRPGAENTLVNFLSVRSNEKDSDVRNNELTHVSAVDPNLAFHATPVSINRQTGNYEQAVFVTNTTCQAVPAVRVYVQGLPSGVRLNNPSGTNETGRVFVQSDVPLLPGDSVRFKMEFTSATATEPKAQYQAVAAARLPDREVTGIGVAVSVSRRKDGSVLLFFDAIPNRTYTIQYADELEVWRTSRPSVVTTGQSVFWIDDGPPKTEAHPSSRPNRFYRVILEK